uniref:Tyrosine-protein kinase n=1 Tax=Panagrellus redivivus TaxID=6233 RepID=A0A7E4VFH6_PANRE
MRRSNPKTSATRRSAPLKILNDREKFAIPPSSSPSDQLQSSNVADSIEIPEYMTGLDEEDFFHGLLIKDDGMRMCKHEGDFVVLTTEISPSSYKSVYVLVKHKDEVTEVNIKQDGTKFCFNDVDGTQFDTIAMLIKHYHKRNLPIFDDYYLKKPIPKADWELLHRKIELKQKLGEGAQAQVQRGLFHGASKTPIEVAVKIHKGDLTPDKLIEIMHEVRIMLQFDHENVVKLVGIASCRAPFLIVLEMVHGGGLNRYLKIKRNEVTAMQRICMCTDAANGLSYIHSLGIIHRDVASRNCLYSQSKQRVLISDFGLSQQEEVYAVDPSKPLPIRWLAPEVMTTYQCTKMTDVWSYGVLCWEIFTNCKDPYSHIPRQTDVMEKVVAGLRLEFAPENVPQPMIEIVQRCWDATPANRPPMAEIVGVMLPFCEREFKAGKKRQKSREGNSRRPIAADPTHESNRSIQEKVLKRRSKRDHKATDTPTLTGRRKAKKNFTMQ